MATQTFAILIQDIKDLTENNSSDFGTQAEEFIETTEIRLSREIKNCPALYKHQTSTLTISDPYITKPSDLITMISFQILSSAAARTPLEYRDVSYINEYWPTRTSTGTPKYYSDWDDDFFLLLQRQALH